MKPLIIWEWSNLSCTAVFKAKLSAQVFPIITSSDTKLSPGLCWRMMRKQTPRACLAQSAAAIVSVSCSQRGLFSCQPSWRLWPQQQEANVLHLPMQTFPCGPSLPWLTGTSTCCRDVVVPWGQARDHDLGIITWPMPRVQVFCTRRCLVAHQWHNSGAKQVSLLALTPLLIGLGSC